MKSFFNHKNLSWGFSEKIWSIVFEGIAFVLFARMLGPEILGQYALVMVLIGLSSVFIEFGTVDAIIREKENKRFESSVFWLSLIIGMLYLVILYSISPLIAQLYKFYQYDTYIVYLFPAIIISSLLVVPVARLKRDGEFHALSKRNMLAGFIGKSVGLMLAYLGHGIWGLIVMTLTNKLIELFVIVFASKWRPYFLLDFSELKSRINFIFYLSASKIVIYFSKKLEVIVVSYFFGFAVVGVYNLASKIMKYVNKLISGVLVPIFYSDVSKRDIVNDKIAINSKYYNVSYFISILYWMLFFTFTLFSEKIIGYLFGQDWLPAAWITSVFLFTLRFVAQGSLTAQILKRYGESKYIYKTFLQSFLVLGLVCLVGASLENLSVIVWATFFSSLVYNYKFLTKCRELTGLRFSKVFHKDLKILLIISVNALLLIAIREWVLSDAMFLFETILAMGLYFLVSLASIVIFDKKLIELTRKLRS